MTRTKRVHEHRKNQNKVSKSNALFNTLFLAFSLAVIAIVAGNNKLADSALTHTSDDSKESSVVYEQEYALNTNFSKAIYQHKI